MRKRLVQRTTSEDFESDMDNWVWPSNRYMRKGRYSVVGVRQLPAAPALPKNQDASVWQSFGGENHRESMRERVRQFMHQTNQPRSTHLTHMTHPTQPTRMVSACWVRRLRRQGCSLPLATCSRCWCAASWTRVRRWYWPLRLRVYGRC